MTVDDGAPFGRVDVPALLKRAEQAYSPGDLLKCEVELTMALLETPDDPALQRALAAIQLRLGVAHQNAGKDTIAD